MKLDQVNYKSLNAKQQELYNFHRLAGRLADFGYYSIKLSDDWRGADFLAVHFNGEDSLKVQLKGRLTFNRKYQGKDIHIAFPHNEDFFVFPHDELLERVLMLKNIGNTKDWIENGHYSWPATPKWALDMMQQYRI
jgi:hypothetical protein